MQNNTETQNPFYGVQEIATGDPTTENRAGAVGTRTRDTGVPREVPTPSCATVEHSGSVRCQQGIKTTTHCPKEGLWTTSARKIHTGPSCEQDRSQIVV